MTNRTPEDILQPGDVVRIKDEYSKRRSGDGSEMGPYTHGIVTEIVNRFDEANREVDVTWGGVEGLTPRVGAPRNVSLAVYKAGLPWNPVEKDYRSPDEDDPELAAPRGVENAHMKALHRKPSDPEQLEEEGVTVIPEITQFHVTRLVLVMKADDTYDEVPRDVDIIEEVV